MLGGLVIINEVMIWLIIQISTLEYSIYLDATHICASFGNAYVKTAESFNNALHLITLNVQFLASYC